MPLSSRRLQSRPTAGENGLALPRPPLAFPLHQAYRIQFLTSFIFSFTKMNFFACLLFLCSFWTHHFLFLPIPLIYLLTISLTGQSNLIPFIGWWHRRGETALLNKLTLFILLFICQDSTDLGPLHLMCYCVSNLLFKSQSFSQPYSSASLHTRSVSSRPISCANEPSLWWRCQ